MATLADVNDQLAEQNKIQLKQTDVLNDVSDGIGKVSNGFSSLFKKFETDKLRQKDIDDEARRARQKETAVRVSPTAKSKSSGLFGGNFLESLKSGGLIGLGAGLVSALPGFLLKRGLPALLANAFADEIAEYVEEATGSEALGDSVFRGLKLGSLGLLISKRLGLIGFAVGAVLTPDNRAKFDELGTNLEEIGTKLENLFGVELPSMAKVTASVSETVGEAIDSLTALTEGDFKGFGDNLGSLAASLVGLGVLLRPGKSLSLVFKTMAGAAGLALSSGKALTSKFFGKDPEGDAKKAATNLSGMSKGELQKANIADVKNLSNEQLSKLEQEGYKVDKDKGTIRNAKGQFVSADTTRGALSRVGVANSLNTQATSKFGKFAKVVKFGKGIPFLGTLISGGLLASILMNDEMSTADKISEIGGIFGGTTGALALGALGTAIGGPLGGLAGLAIGGIGGDILGRMFAEWLVGGSTGTTGILGRGNLNPLQQGGSDQSFDEFGNIGSDGAQVSAPAPFTGPMLNDVVAQSNTLGGNAPVVVYTDASNKSVNTSSTGGAVVSAPLGYAGLAASQLDNFIA